MRRGCLILSVFLILLSLNSFSQNNGNDIRLRQTVKEKGQAEVAIQFTGTSSLDKLSRNVSILSLRDKQVHLSLSPLTVEWFIDQNYDYTIVLRSETKGIETAGSVKSAMAWDKYPTYQQYDSIMQSFILLYPALCHLDTIGTSINGKLVLALKISDNAGITETEPEVFYTSSMHGDELGGYILMLRLADYLLKNYGTSQKVKSLVDNLQIWINPLANPDGTYRNSNTIVNAIRYNANSIDLNRNFPDPLYPYSSTHIQQKETTEMIAFMRKHNFVISANFHAGAEVVNYPWDRYYSIIHADDSWFYTISRAYADTVHLTSSPYYMNFMDNGITRGAVWYRIEGGRQDFVTSDLQGREVTIELDDSFITPAAQLNLLWQNNWRSLLGYISNALYGVHGIVTNVTNSGPVKARVFINGHDKDSSHVYSSEPNGSFYRYLSPGSWNLTFSAPGYVEQTVSNVQVVSGQRTELAVTLTPVVNSIDTTDPEQPVLYPNPSSSTIKAVIADNMLGDISIFIFSQTGILISEYKTTAIIGSPLNIDVSGMSPGKYYVRFVNDKSKLTAIGRFIVIN